MDRRLASTRSHPHHIVNNNHHNASQQQQHIGRPVSTIDAATACDAFEHFIRANTLKTILGTYRHICDLLHLRPNILPLFYPKLKSYLTSWKAKALWKKFDARANHKCYGGSKICPGTRVLIIGAGPCGLRTAIDAQLLGAKVVVVEKRDRLSRNNVLHLWPFVIEDLRGLGAKKFFGKFCAGAIDHISIRQLQCILLKVALLLGVEVHTEVSFEKLVEPNDSDKIGWRAEFKPSEHPISQYEFDVIIGADGKRNTLQGFQRNELRGKLAIAITANFINYKTEIEARVQEISGVAYIFNQKFFKDLKAETGIDLENIVYYKDETHYFVMTARKQSLINKGVIMQDFMDTAKLLAPENVNREKLMSYAREAADFSTNYQLPDLQFAVNYYGEPDVAMFDFTSIYAAENASRVVERNGYRLLMELVGDSLLEPFWPTGSGCARGFLSSMDACWAIRAWGSGISNPLEVVAERESIYRLLGQTTPDKLNKDYKSYTIDPTTRYPNLNKNLLVPRQVVCHYDSDNPAVIDEMLGPPGGMIESSEDLGKGRHKLQPEVHRKRRRRDTNVDPNTLLNWVKEQVREYDLEVEDITNSFKDGRVLCAIIHHYRPDLLDYSVIKAQDVDKNNQLAFDLLEKEIGIPPILTGEEMAIAEIPDYLTMLSYLTQIYDTFRVEIPHIKYPKLELPDIKISDRTPQKSYSKFSFPKAEQAKESSHALPVVSRSKRHVDTISNKTSTSDSKRPKKRKSFEKIGATMVERQKRIEEIAANRADRQSKRRQQRKLQTEQFLKSMQMMQATVHSPQPFEDYSIFLYRQNAPNFEDRVKDLEKKFSSLPDKDSQLPTQTRGGTDEDFAARIKEIEQKWTEPVYVEKKPKDLLRAIGKIETSDWNIKEIEKKIHENKHGKVVNKEKEKVPKWNREQFLARQTKMEKKGIIGRQESVEARFTEFDKSIKQLDQKLKEGSVRELGQNKVASITEKLTSKIPENESKPIVRTNSKPAIPTQGGSEYCHFCQKRVYLMERLSAEGKFFHRGCFRCQYCHTSLRLGSYLFDKDGRYGNRFYCSQHFGMPGELYSTKIGRKASQKIVRDNAPQLEKLQMPTSGVLGVDLLDRVKTPERVEFANLSTGHLSSDHEESFSQMDEDEWTDRNFGASAAEISEDESSSSERGLHKRTLQRLLRRILWRTNSLCSIDSESDNEDVYEEALEEPATKEGTLRWVERCLQRYSRDRGDEDSVDDDEYSSSSEHSSYYENSSGDEDDDTATEGEEEILARQLRKQEVCLEPPVVQTDTGSETEIVSDETSSESSGKGQNSATEVSTDSEFALDDPTPTRERPPISFSEVKHKKRWATHHVPPKKVQVKSGMLQIPVNGSKTKVHEKNRGIELEFTPLVPSPVLPKPPAQSLFPRSEGYALNRTQSTGGIATKVSLELKKKYLLGDNGGPGTIQKSGSVSALDSKLKSFHSNISDCQKLLKPALEVSSSMQIFCNKMEERKSPLSPIFSQSSPMNENGKSKPPDLVDLTLSLTEKTTLETDLVKNTPCLTMQPDITKCTEREQKATNEEPKIAFEHELEGRPRSPVKDIPIIVPQIDWTKKKRNMKFGDDIYVDSLTSESENERNRGNKTINIPRLEIHDDFGKVLPNNEEEIAQDSLCVVEDKDKANVEESVPEMKSKKLLNQPKTLPDLGTNILSQFHSESHEKKYSPVCSTPSEHDSLIEQITAAMTETELSDWARDGVVSDDLEDDFDFNSSCKMPNHITTRKTIKNEIGSKTNKNEHQEAFFDSLKNIHNSDSGSIEFMDNGVESSSDERELYETRHKNNGYIHLQEEDDIVQDSLNIYESLPKKIIESKNHHVVQSLDYNCLSTTDNNTGYCFFGNEDSHKETTDTKVPEKKSMCENIDNLVVTEQTTTDENSISNSTIKNITEKEYSLHDKEYLFPTKSVKQITSNEKLQEMNIEVFPKESLRNDVIELEEIAMDKKCKNSIQVDEKEASIDVFIQNLNDEEYQEHCQRLQSKIGFGNVRDSIDIRKSKRKEKSDSIPQQTSIAEEKLKEEVTPLPFTSRLKMPGALYSKEEIKKERDENQKLIQEMVLNKMKAQNKSLERKKRNKTSLNPFQLCKSATIDIVCPRKESKNSCNTPDVLLSTVADTKNGLNENNQKLDLHSKTPQKSQEILKEVQKTAEKMKHDAKHRAQLKSDKDFGLSPEDKLQKLRQKYFSDKEALQVERPTSLLYTNDTLKKKKNNSKEKMARTKSVSEISRPLTMCKSFDIIADEKCVGICRSDPNLLHETTKKTKKKSNNLENRKSITKLISDFFNKKKDEVGSPNSSKSFLSRISSRTKDKSKSLSYLNRRHTAEKIYNEPVRSKSYSDVMNSRNDPSPPPIPPLPVNYTGCRTDESSDGEFDHRELTRNSFDTLYQSIGARRSIRNRRASKQTQLKRHRLAQELQRKLEEVEVKTRQLEERGVLVEKKLRGEIVDSHDERDESDLLEEWFDLMRDLNELRRYERELTVRAQELELEDRHARLQVELRERLESDEHKTKEDLKTESSIINEMMDIVAKRDSLVVLLEQDRLRYSEENRDFEEQMLARGLKLTSINKSTK